MNPSRVFHSCVALLLLSAIAPIWAADDPDLKWIADAKGCKAVNPFPRPGETATWSGACVNGLMEGDGVMQWLLDGKPDDRYEGHMSAGWAEGEGTLTRADGGRYAGSWKKSLQDGSGRYEGADGAVYEGDWKDGQPHGMGQMRTPDGQVINGHWTDGEFDGPPQDGNPNRI
jgi:hypothetical protein